MLKNVEFFYLRHGETDWNRERRMQGQIDIPLNETGLRQAEAARDILQKVSFSTICTSPLQRAKRTAEIIAQKQNCPLIEIDSLKEVTMGPYEGQVKGQMYSDWFAGLPVTGVEAMDVFLQRVSTGLNDALNRNGPVLIVAHGGTYRAINRYIPSSPDATMLPNAVPIRHQPTRAVAGGWEIEIFSSAN